MWSRWRSEIRPLRLLRISSLMYSFRRPTGQGRLLDRAAALPRQIHKTPNRRRGRGLSPAYLEHGHLDRTTVAILVANDVRHARSLLPGCGPYHRQCRHASATKSDDTAIVLRAESGCKG